MALRGVADCVPELADGLAHIPSGVAKTCGAEYENCDAKNDEDVRNAESHVVSGFCVLGDAHCTCRGHYVKRSCILSP